MNTLIRTACLFVAIAASLVAIPAAAQKLRDPTVAPVPALILSAKKVFIANGGSLVESAADTIVPNLPYDEFYAGMQSWSRFELLSAPADADLVLEIRFVTVSPTILGKDGARTRRQVELLFIDPKTHITLWTIYEQFDGALLNSNKRKDLDAGIAALLRDLKKLAASTEPAAHAYRVEPAGEIHESTRSCSQAADHTKDPPISNRN